MDIRNYFGKKTRCLSKTQKLNESDDDFKPVKRPRRLVRISSSSSSDSTTDHSEIMTYVKNDKHKSKSSKPYALSKESNVSTPAKQMRKLTVKDESSNVEIQPIIEESKQNKMLKIPKSSPKHKKLNESTQESYLVKQAVKNENIESNIDDRRLWVDKYRPMSVSKIIGQQGQKSPLSKLLAWLECWKKPKHDVEGRQFKSVLISGPPGIGKTTTAHLACQHLGFSISDLNSSDTRSKNTLQLELSSATSSFAVVQGQSQVKSSCIIMDEVDGMAGNEDRGGIQELISIIKSTKIPIICICNDRQHTKIRSLANHCFDLRFQRLRKEQIRACLLSILSKEKRKIDNILLDQLIDGCNGDLRQAIHSLHMLLSSANAINMDACSAKETLSMSAFDLCRQIFLPNMNDNPLKITDRMDMFFHDYNLIPLFVQENYPRVSSEKGKNKLTACLAECAAYIALADIMSNSMRSLNNWTLLRTVAMFSSAIPCHLKQGYMSGIINFPAWLGKQSKQNRIKRQLEDTHSHYRIKQTINKTEFRLFAAYPLMQMIYKPVASHGADGLKRSCALAQSAYLQKQDLDNIAEICFDFKIPLDSKLKAAFTKCMKQTHVLYPYQLRDRGKLPAIKENLDFMDGSDTAQSENSSGDEDSEFVKNKVIKRREVTKNNKGAKVSPSERPQKGRRPTKPKKNKI
ncbi:hypothetical protein GJ496_004439 [Pomphorhynchus laevis]|nr:hypothetical protein GJ496_005384 [Pomphorhynchus laevis]KAI0981295.1 hypothetical protein GJ496_004439 [Pomphorhynchus laevis]